MVLHYVSIKLIEALEDRQHTTGGFAVLRSPDLCWHFP
jgi:hypothetical protein